MSIHRQSGIKKGNGLETLEIRERSGLRRLQHEELDGALWYWVDHKDLQPQATTKIGHTHSGLGKTDWSSQSTRQIVDLEEHEAFQPGQITANRHSTVQLLIPPQSQYRLSRWVYGSITSTRSVALDTLVGSSRLGWLGWLAHPVPFPVPVPRKQAVWEIGPPWILGLDRRSCRQLIRHTKTNAVQMYKVQYFQSSIQSINQSNDLKGTSI